MSVRAQKPGPVRNAAIELAGPYARLGRYSVQGIGGAMGAAMRRTYVSMYVRDYLRAHGRFPVGRHQAHGTYGGSGIRFDVVFPGKGMAALFAAGHRMTVDEVWGMPQSAQDGAFGRARREYRQSPERNRLRAWLLEQIEGALRDPMSGGAPKH